MSTSRVTVYSVDVITFNFAGIDLADGMGKGGFLKITQPDPNWTYTKGIGKEAAFNHKSTGAVEIEVTFLQTAKQNALLSAYHILSEAANGLPAPLFYEDRKGSSKIVGTDAVLTQMPDENLGDEADDITWKFIVHAPQRFVGQH